MTRVLTGLSVQIAHTKISTFGEHIIDVFYVKDVFGMKIKHEAAAWPARSAEVAA